MYKTGLLVLWFLGLAMMFVNIYTDNTNHVILWAVVALTNQMAFYHETRKE